MSNSYRNLPSPWFSQRENRYVWKQKYTSDDVKNSEFLSNEDIGQEKPNGNEVSLADNSCNITCLAMLLNYFSITTETPDDILKNIFDPPGEDESVTDIVKALREQTYNDHTRIQYLSFLKEVVEAFYPNARVITSHLKKGLDYVEHHVANGFPVMISCGIARRYAEFYYTNLVANSISEINKIKRNYQIRYNSSYDADLKQAQDALENAAEDDKAQAQEHIDNIQARYDREKQARLDEYLDYYRHKGHYIVVRGFTPNHVIINDPWGSPVNNQGNIQVEGDREGQGYYSFSPFGDNIKIPRDQFEQQYNEIKNIWATLVIYHFRWGFVFNNNTIPRGMKPTRAMFDDCYAQETFSYGGFPMKRSNLWHNGIHINTGNGSMVYPMGPGQIIAARIMNEDPDDRESDPAPINGSRCFVLVKHQILLDKETVKDFFSLYMHLSPLENFPNMVKEYPENNTGISWLDSLLFRSNKFFRICWGRKAKIYRVSDNEQRGFLNSSEIKSYEKTEDGKYFYYHKGEYCYSFKEEENRIKIITYYNYNTNTSEYIEKYKTVLESLSKGKITYFNDLPDPYIEVSSSISLGQSGTYGGYDSDESNLLHWEVFSNDNFVDSFPSPNGEIHLIDYDKTRDLGMCNRREMIDMFHNEAAYESDITRLVYLEDDGIITKKEMETFYASPLSNNLRKYICQHRSEWAEGIDWEKEFNFSVGIASKGIWLWLKEKLSMNSLDNLQDFVKYVYDPYKWLNDEMVSNMNSSETNHLQEGCATYYNPIRLLEWLYDKDERIIMEFTE